MALPNEPITRQEMFLSAIAGEETQLPGPITREEQYLDYIARNGGGGGGVSKAYVDEQDNLRALAANTYNKSEVNSLIADVNQFSIEIVDELPTTDIDTHTIYFVPKDDGGENDSYDEYIYINDTWEHIGSTEIDLSQYYTKTETDELLNLTQAHKEISIGTGTGHHVISGKAHSVDCFTVFNTIQTQSWVTIYTETDDRYKPSHDVHFLVSYYRVNNADFGVGFGIYNTNGELKVYFSPSSITSLSNAQLVFNFSFINN